MPLNVTALLVGPALAVSLAGCGPQTDGAPPIETCKDPVAACVLSNGMSLQTHEAPRVLTPIQLTLREVPVQVTAVRVEGGMAGMSMPPVSVDLRNTGPAEWGGELILPVCSQSRSDWVWTVITRIDNGERRTPVMVEAANR